MNITNVVNGTVLTKYFMHFPHQSEKTEKEIDFVFSFFVTWTSVLEKRYITSVPILCLPFSLLFSSENSKFTKFQKLWIPISAISIFFLHVSAFAWHNTHPYKWIQIRGWCWSWSLDTHALSCSRSFTLPSFCSIFHAEQLVIFNSIEKLKIILSLVHFWWFPALSLTHLPSPFLYYLSSLQGFSSFVLHSPFLFLLKSDISIFIGSQLSQNFT